MPNSEKKSFWEKLATFVVDRRGLFFCIFAALIVFSCFSSSWVKVENNIINYLAEDTETRQGLELMDEEFVTYGTAQVMVEHISEEDASALRERLAAIEGVGSVGFDPSSERSYNRGSALFSVTFDYEGSDERCVEAFNAVKDELAGYDTKISSEVGSDLSGMIAKEMQLIVIIVALVVVGVLIFTSGTYAEVPVLLITFLVAAFINKGTNFLFGTISFVSNSVTIVLQLALSVDYAIILCNRFKEERLEKPVREAAIAALSKAIPEISASSLTTIAGLAAMTFMQFRLGMDMGLVLIKAIVLSLLTVFFLMPGLLVLFGGAMEKSKHKSFVPKVPFIGKFAYATRYVIPPLFVLLVVGACMIFQSCNFVYGEATLHTVKQNETQIAERAITETFGEDNLMCVVVPSGDYEKEQELQAALEECPEVKSVLGLAGYEAMNGVRLGDSVTAADFRSLTGMSYTVSQAVFAYYAAANSDYDEASQNLSGYSVPLVDLFLFLHDEAEKGSFELSEAQAEQINGLYAQLAPAKSQLQSDSYSRMLVYLDLPDEGEETFAFVDEMHDIVGRYYEDFYVIGDSGSRYELAQPFSRDNTIVGLLSIVFVLVILLFTFKSVALPLLLILVIQGSIWTNFAIPTATGVNVFFLCYLIVSAIQMGANIDYAIVISSRYLELRKSLDRKPAIIETMNLAFPTVITSGSMMAIAGLLIGNLSSEPVIAGIGKYVGIGTLITIVFVMFVLPQLLIFGDGVISATTVKLKGRIKNPRRLAVRALGAVLALASVAALVLLPIGLSNNKKSGEENRARNAALTAQVEDIESRLTQISAGAEIYDASKMDFATGVVTDKVGSQKLDEGQAQYDAGASQLSEGQAQYDAAAQELAGYEAEYAAGQLRLSQGRQEYQQGVARLEEAKKQYAEGEAKLKAVEPTYNKVLPLYNEYQRLLKEYNESDAATQLLLRVGVKTAEKLFTTELSGTGYSIEKLISEYDAGKAQLADGAQQIADGEKQLAEAQQQIEEGQAQLDAAAARLSDGRAQLSDAKAQLDAGYSQLDDAASQLESGKKTLEANEYKIYSSLQNLKQYDDAKQYVDAGIDILMQDKGIAAKAGGEASYEGVCSAARRYLAENAEKQSRALAEKNAEYWAGIAAAVLLLATSLYLLLRSRRPQKANILKEN